jgi:outer membrane immunogenic protein
MRTLLMAAAAAGLTLSMGAVAHAADAPALPVKAPPAPPPAYSWTGCYAGVGGGYGMYNEELKLDVVRALPGIPAGTTFVDGPSQGGRGWLATVQLGCDYQFASPIGGGNWLVGAFADYDYSHLTGNHTGGDVNIGLQGGEERMRHAWAVGARFGYIVTPRFLTFVDAGYTQASFGTVDYVSNLFPVFGAPTGLELSARTYSGWFVGAGTEYALGWLPGLFWKSEYRFANYGSRTDTVICTSAALCGVAGPTAFAEQTHPYVQTVRTELVWRF